MPHAEISPEPCGPGVQRRVLAYSKDAMCACVVSCIHNLVS